MYDASGNLVGMNLNGAQYFYEFNAQGDIIGIVDTSANEVVSYVYDSWGKIISTTGTLASTVGAKNPYRYRGYRLDAETGLYYLQSRYYSPEWGRFLNTDVMIAKTSELLTANMFAYCKNNPVNMIDVNGDYAIAVVAATPFIVAAMVTYVIWIYYYGNYAVANPWSSTYPTFRWYVNYFTEKMQKALDNVIVQIQRFKYKISFYSTSVNYNNGAFVFSSGGDIGIIGAARRIIAGGDVYCSDPYIAWLFAEAMSLGSGTRSEGGGLEAFHYHTRNGYSKRHIFYGNYRIYYR